jgi:hypothetical protein
VAQDLVISHWIGCTPTSSSYTALLSRVLAELKELLNSKAPLPKDELLVAEACHWMEKALKEAGRHRLVRLYANILSPLVIIIFFKHYFFFVFEINHSFLFSIYHIPTHRSLLF